MSTPNSSADLEPVEDFRARARAFIEANLPPSNPSDQIGMLRPKASDEHELAEVNEDRRLQRLLFDGGLAGVCVPTQYGGQGLTPAHQIALREELAGYSYPTRIQAPTFAPCASVLLEFGTEEQKLRHIPAILKGEELWMQLLSEPSGGSDVAAALTTAVRDGDEWVLNGSKVWTTGAWWSDWGLCLARTNWDVPKHRGLSVFIFPLHQPGIEVHRIEMLNGFKDFCQEFISDVRVSDSNRIGDIDEGWTVGTRWMFHERMLYNSPLVTIPIGNARQSARVQHNVQIARAVGRIDDPVSRDLIGEARMLERVGEALQSRISTGIRTRTMSDQSASIGRLYSGISATRMTTIAYELGSAYSSAWEAEDGMAGEWGNDFLMRQVSTIGGGTTEMARNVVAERVLGMPRERSNDREVAFRDIPKGPSSAGAS